MSEPQTGASGANQDSERSNTSDHTELAAIKTGQQPVSSLGKTDQEDEAGHLRRVADELGGAHSRSLVELRDQLNGNDEFLRRTAAAGLGALGDRNAIALLRRLLEGDIPEDWELAVYGLRQSRDRSGWLCLESVALDLLHTFDTRRSADQHAFRLLVMGRTKTMDRLFRAIDGHSRTIPVSAAKTFTTVAVSSVPFAMARVMAMRLGLTGTTAIKPLTPEQVTEAIDMDLETVRQLEAEGWETVQRPRAYHEIRRNYEGNNDRLWPAD